MSLELSDLIQSEDAQLVGRAQRGDRKSFSELVRRHQVTVYRVCYRILGNHQDAEDAAQEAFIRAYSKLESFHGRSAFKTWMTRLAVNVSLNELERRRWTAPLTEEHESRAPRPDAEVIRAEAATELQAALQRIAPNHRAAVVLRDLEGMSYREIAEHLEIPDGTAKGWVHRGRQQLKELLT